MGIRGGSAIRSGPRGFRGREVWCWRTTGQISDRNRCLRGFPTGVAVIEEFVLGANRNRRKPENNNSKNSRHETVTCFPKSHLILYRKVRVSIRFLTPRCSAAILQKYQARQTHREKVSLNRVPESDNRDHPHPSERDANSATRCCHKNYYCDYFSACGHR